jgi:tRNA-splicing ligase RtcB
MTVKRIGNVFSWASILEDNTLEQAQRTASLPFLAGPLALMPDAHLGMGATIGTVIPTQGAIIPSAIGVDIGCGMAAVKTDLFASGIPDNFDKMVGWIERVVPAGMGKRQNSHHRVGGNESLWRQAASSITPGTSQWKTAEAQLGTLGGGNHFIEICLDENDQVWVVLHSGSRGIGNQIASRYIEDAKGLMRQYFIELPDPELAYLVEGTTEFTDYIRAMQWAQNYALANREAMLDAVLKQLWAYVGVGEREDIGHEVERINCHHNYTEMEHHHGKDVWLTRKGAIRAREGDLGIIPGSMGTSSYIVAGLGNPLSYNSCSHGAGRTMSRNAARKTLLTSDLESAMLGKAWNSDKAVQLLDEAPGAYKDIDVVMEDQKDLATIKHTLHQILNFKGTK